VQLNENNIVYMKMQKTGRTTAMALNKDTTPSASAPEIESKPTKTIIGPD